MSGGGFGHVEMSNGMGLQCRWPGECGAWFIPVPTSSLAAIRDAAVSRDEHEHEVHGYWHVIIKLTKWGYQDKFSTKGRSTLSIRKKGLT